MKRERVQWFRIARQGLGERRREVPAEAFRCPASDFSRDAALLALLARVEGIGREGYDDAVDSGALVLAPTLRAALHVQAPDDFALFGRALLATGDAELAQQLGRQARGLLAAGEIAAGDALDEVAEATEATLANGRKLDKNELHQGLRERVREELMPWCKGCESHHVAPMLWRFGGVRAGLRRDAEGRYLIGRPKPKGKPGPAEAVRRFLRFYGPARERDFVTWSGVPKEMGAGLWEAVEAETVEVEWADATGSLLAADVDSLEAAARPEGVRLIPPNDPYLGQPDRATLVPDRELSKRIFRPVASPGVVLVDGRIAGLWKARAKGKRSSVEIEELSRVPRRAATAEAERVGAVRGSDDVELSWV